ncbi:MAG: MATE family efflux transporter [Sphaerochaetaceae bacterium]|nr:MATE family efflux transporter [Sphaerochaetaceae bacterium]
MADTNANRNLMTEGVIWKQLVRFLFPILLGTLFQTLYNTADAVIVGNILGKEALAAVGGGTGTIINLLIGFFTGIASGATVIISQHYGAKQEDLVHRAIHNACAFALWGGIGMSVIGYVATDWLLKIINTPMDVFPLASQYMHIYFAGTSIVLMYNIGAGIFQAFGDSDRPLYFLVVGCIVNIAMDLLLVGVFKMGVAGAALATVISQLIPLILVVLFLMRRNDCCKLELRKIRFDMRMLKRTLYIGLPSGLQSVMYTVSNLMIVANINNLGTDTVAAWSAYGRLDSLFWMFNGALGIAITTFVGQNYGAGLMKRSKKGVRECFAIAFSIAAVLETILLLFSRYAYRLFVQDEAVIQIGVRIMNVICPFYAVYLIVEILSGAIRGTGKTFIATMITVFGIIGFRTVWFSVVPHFFQGLDPIIICYPVTWVIAAIAFIIYYNVGNIYDKEELAA